MDRDLHARRSDPNSSHRRVQLLGRDGSVRRVMLDVAAHHDGPFTDGDLWFGVERVLNRREQRNVIARHRGLMEADGLFERLGVMRHVDTGDDVLHFILTSRARELLGIPLIIHSPVQETLL